HGPDLLEKPADPSAGREHDDRADGTGATSASADAEAKTTIAGDGGAEKPAAAAKAAAGKASTVKTPSGSTAPPEPPPAQGLVRFLDRITSGLYVGEAEEFARCFRQHAERVATSPRERSELLELAADLQVQLDRQPDLDRLRDYWTRVSALDGGVLFEAASDA